MRIKRNLLISVACLIMSVIICCLLCCYWIFAWFAKNEKTDVNGLNVNLDGPDIQSLTVKAFTLKDKTQNGNTVTYKEDSQIVDTTFMNEYDMLDSSVTTVLIEIDYTLKAGTSSDKKFTLGVRCNGEKDYTITKDDISLTDSENDIYTCNLSYVVGFQLSDVTIDGDVISTVATDFTDGRFAVLDSTTNKYVIKNTLLTISDSITNDVTQTSGTFYILMDYSELNINNLYTLLLEKGNAGLQTQFMFNDDIEFIIQEN